MQRLLTHHSHPPVKRPPGRTVHNGRLAMATMTCGLLTLATLIVPHASLAQVPRERQPERERLNISAKFESFQRGMLYVVSEEGDHWLLKLEAKPQDVSYYAKSEVAWLKPGMFVQFTGRFTEKGKAVEPVTELRIITPRETTRFGIYPEASAGGLGDVNLFDNPEKAGEAAPAARPTRSGDEAKAYQIVGRLARFRRGEMTVFAGRPIEVEVADDADVSLDVADVSLLRPGDSVKVEGWYLPGRKGLAVVNRVTAQAAEPLLVPEKKVRTLPGQKPPTDEAEQPEGKPEADGEAADAPEANPFEVE